jgi:hypothetical protein
MPAHIVAASRWPRSRRGTFGAAYVLRSLHALPKSGIKRPWFVRLNYLVDAIDYRFDRIEEAMVFGRVSDRAFGQGRVDALSPSVRPSTYLAGSPR